MGLVGRLAKEDEEDEMDYGFVGIFFEWINNGRNKKMSL